MGVSDVGRDSVLRKDSETVETHVAEQPGRPNIGPETESYEPGRQKRRRVARLLVLLVVAVPVAYSIVMGVITIVRYILADLR
jgi:hypothetical protein